MVIGDEILAGRQLSVRRPSVSVYSAPVSGQTQTPSLLAAHGCPGRPPHPTRRAGTPTTRAKSGTSLVTTAPAATSAQRPTITGATQTARAPMAAPSPMTTPTAVQSSPDFS